MGWGTDVDLVRAVPAARRAARVTIDDVGHFVHIEKPDVVAEMVLEFLEMPA